MRITKPKTSVLTLLLWIHFWKYDNGPYFSKNLQFYNVPRCYLSLLIRGNTLRYVRGVLCQNSRNQKHSQKALLRKHEGSKNGTTTDMRQKRTKVLFPKEFSKDAVTNACRGKCFWVTFFCWKRNYRFCQDLQILLS